VLYGVEVRVLSKTKPIYMGQKYGSMPEWLMGADCKSAGLPTLVQIQFGPIDKRGCGGMVDTGDLKSPAGDGVRVQFPPATIISYRKF
jgi:hypothetical protein